MRRRVLGLAAVLFAVYLVVSASPVMAATNEALGSISTTDTDFNNAATLHNVSVSGSGSSAVVRLDSSGETIEDFESGNLNDYSGDTGVFSVQSTTVFSGTYALQGDKPADGSVYEIHSTTGAANNPQAGETFEYRTRIASSGSSTDWQTHFLFGYQDSSNYYGVAFDRRNGEFALIKTDGGSTTTLDNQAITASNYEDEWMRVEVDWGAAGQLTATLYDSGGTQVAQVTASDSTFTSGNIGFLMNSGGDAVEAYWDNINIVGAPIENGRYISQNHSVTNPTKAFVNLTTVDNVSVNADVERWTGSAWATAETATYTTTGNKTIVISDDGDKWRLNLTVNKTIGTPSFEFADEGLLFLNHDPVIDNTSASPTGQTDSASQTLSIDITDQEFPTAQGDSVDVEFFTKGPNDGSFSSEGTDTLTSNGTATQAITANIGGTWEWRAVASDAYGGQTTSQDFSFQVPSNVTVYNETNPTQQLTSVNVTGRFFGDDTIIVNETNTGAINLTGKPVDEPIVLVLEADGYHTRAVIVESVFEQQRVYMLNTSEPSVEVRFELEDFTGNFPEDESRLIIQKAITRNGNTQWEAVAGDEFGVAGINFDLHDERRHRLILKNEGGDSRILGAYTTSVSETVTLDVGSLTFGINETVNEWTWDASYRNSTSPATVSFNYSDPTDSTTDIQVVIYERGNATNEIYNSTHAGPYGNLSVSQPIPADKNESTWVVDWEADYGGETIHSQRIVGPRSGVLPTLDPVWKKAASVMIIFMTAGLFSQLNAPTGAVVTALVAGMLWQVQWLGGATSGFAIVIALGTAIWIKYSTAEPTI